MKKAVCILLISSLLFTSGCWDYSDYETLTLVSAMGFDMEENSNEITVTIQYTLPMKAGMQQQGSGGQQTPVSGALAAEGTVVSDALEKIQRALGKRLFYGYLDLFVLGRTAAENIASDIIGFADRTPNVRTTAYVAVTEGKAQDVLTTMDPNITITSGRNIHDLITESVNAGIAFPVSLADFSEIMAISGSEPVMPVVSAVFKEKNTVLSEDPEKDQPVKFIRQKEGYHTITGVAAFSSDRLTGFLDAKESTGLGWIKNKSLHTYESVELSSENNTLYILVFYITNAKSDIKAEISDGSPVIKISTQVQAELRKYVPVLPYETLSPDVIALMEEKVAESVRAEISAAVYKAQKELKTDIFGFGFALFRSSPGLWHSQFENKWRDIFPDVQIDINVKARITDTGTSLKKLPMGK
jgi:spore germination protein KC